MRLSAAPFSDARQLAAIDALIGAAPERSGLRFARACCLEDLGRTDEAIRAYLDLLVSEPRHFGALTNLGCLLLERGLVAEARRYLEVAVELQPSDVVAQVNAGDARVASGDDDAARDAYASALAINADSLHANLGLAGLYRRGNDFARERHHLDRAYGKPRLWRYPYRGSSRPLEVLLLASASGGDVVSHRFLDPARMRASVLLADSAGAEFATGRYDVIFNAIGDAERAGPSLERAAAMCATATLPVVNQPAAVLRTGRVDVMRTLRGIPGLRAPRTERFERDGITAAALAGRGLTFPLLLRTPGHHAGMHFAEVACAADLAGVVASLPGRELLAIEFLDARGADGNVRKYRIVAVDGRLYPVHLAISAHWKVHYFSADMAARPEHRAEEAAFLADMRGAIGSEALDAVAAACRALELDYAGIDFGLDAAGRVLAFEANAAMAVYLPPAGEMWSYRIPAVERVVRAVADLIVTRGSGAARGACDAG